MMLKFDSWVKARSLVYRNQTHIMQCTHYAVHTLVMNAQDMRNNHWWAVDKGCCFWYGGWIWSIRTAQATRHIPDRPPDAQAIRVRRLPDWMVTRVHSLRTAQATIRILDRLSECTRRPWLIFGYLTRPFLNALPVTKFARGLFTLGQDTRCTLRCFRSSRVMGIIFYEISAGGPIW